MEPQLISRKTIKKILKKNYFVKDNYFNKFFNEIANSVKINWIPIIIIILAIILLIHLYVEQKNRKKAEKLELELEKIVKIDKKEKFDTDTDDFKSKPNYESEYYKMIPRVMSNPDVIPYQY
jgi:beta-lactamase regulating signal transducer with metallopeptidase domain